MSWINRSPSTLKTFVANRVSEIQTVSTVNEWYFIKGTDNPADHLSRGLFPTELVQCKHWFQGPEFLRTPKHTWVLEKAKDIHSKDSQSEVKTVYIINKLDNSSFFEKINHKNLFKFSTLC